MYALKWHWYFFDFDKCVINYLLHQLVQSILSGPQVPFVQLNQMILLVPVDLKIQLNQFGQICR
jgi:hypothetical protein